MPDTRPIPGFPGYFADTEGNIYSEMVRGIRGRQATRARMMLKSAPHRLGRRSVVLCRGGKHLNRYVHRLVLETFVGPRPLGMECCHYNGDPSDNRLENLRWDTKSANAKDAVRHGTFGLRGVRCPKDRVRRGEENNLHKLTDSQVDEIRFLAKCGVSRSDLAEGFCITRCQVWRIVTNRSRKGIK